MSRPELVPFADEHLEDASRLLAARHARHREAEPLLSERYEDSAETLGELERAWRSEAATGAAALRAGRLVGYLVGAPRDPEVWGENIWVELPGHAVEDAEDARDLYGHAAARWVEEGHTRHYALVPADPPLVDAWFRVGFGQQAAHGIRALTDDDLGPLPDGVREAEARDLDAILELSPLMSDQHALAPVFGRRPRPEGEGGLPRELLADIEDEDLGELVFERDGRILGEFEVVPVDKSSRHIGLARPESAAFLRWAATRRDVRGSGVGLALTLAAFSWARSRGYAVIVTDWRVTNLLASRFWPRRGFRASVLRLYRSIP